MSRRFVCDRAGVLTAEIEAEGPVLEAALAHEKAEAVLRCAVLMAVSALAEGGAWPGAVLQAMAAFMTMMKNEIGNQYVLDGAANGSSRHRATDRKCAR